MLLRFPFVLKTASAMSLPEYHRTNNNNPPETPETKPNFGSYCIRSECKMMNPETNEIDYIFKGYDINTDITERVSNYCTRKLDQSGKSELICTEPQITFTNQTKGCDGHIMVYDTDTTTITIIPPPSYG